MKTIYSIFVTVISCLLGTLIISCKKDQPKDMPALTTTTATNITSTTATCGGTITSDGNTPVTSRGICWSTNQNPTISDSKTSDGSGIGTFISSITGLSPGTTYYARAYAANVVGTAYGTQITIITTSVLPVLTTTDLLGISSTTATGGGNITSDGGAAVIARGVCWSRNPMPTVRVDSTTTNGTNTGIFTSSITGLSPGKAYYIRAYATNSVGTAYGNQVTATTTAVLPVLSTTEVTAITPTTATSGGNITNDGGSTITARGVCWSTSQDPTTANSKTTNDTGTGNFTSSITVLAFGTTYFVRAYASNSVGTGYGKVATFTTLVPSNNPDYKPTGLIPMTISEMQTIPTVESAHPLSVQIVKSSGTLPSKVILQVPPHGTQRYNDCTGWVVGYGMLSYLFKNVEGHNGYNSDADLFSPFYIWNQLNGGNDVGISSKQALKLIKEEGCCKLTYMPLSSTLSLLPSSTAKANAANFKLTDYNRFGLFNINNFKKYLADSLPLVVGVHIDEAFKKQDNSQFERQQDGRLVWKKYTDDTHNLPHAMLIYGYDDQINAFKVLNSWKGNGWNWANDGSFWLDYDFLKIAVINESDLFFYQIFVGFVERPVLSTRAVSEITNTTAKCGGIISNDWGKTVNVNGVCWSTNHDPTISDNRTYDATGSDSFLSSISGLSSGSKYYVKAYAINSEGTAYGKEKQFTTTSSTQNPTVMTTPVTIYNSTSANVGGNVTTDGGSTVTERGIYWSTNPLTTGTKLQIGSGTGEFSTNLTGLIQTTTYYVKAYAINSQGTGYGSQVNFTTVTIPIPTAAFTATPTTISVGQCVQFTDQSTNTPSSWFWNFGDGGTSTTQDPSHTYASAGIYTVSMTATNSYGYNSERKTNYITVNSATPTVTDIDGNIYHIVTIGTQDWLVDNLKTTKYRNGNLIGTTTPSTLNITAEPAPKYQWSYAGNESNVAIYGRLYTWYAATDSRNICPTGWHLPSDSEWTTLTTFLGGESVAGGKLKETGTTHWQSPNTGATNSSGFTALPGGYRHYGGTFNNFGYYCHLWSSTEGNANGAWYRDVRQSNSSVYRDNGYLTNGFSVRCIRNY